MTTEQNDYQGGHTPLTPPPAADSAAPVGPPNPSGPTGSGRSGGPTAIVVVTAVIGGLALLGAGGGAAVAATHDLRSSATADETYTADVEGIDRLELDADASSVHVEFGDVDEATLEVTNGGPAWTFERDGDQLTVRSPQTRWGWWFGNWFGDEEIVVLTLPDSLRDAQIDGDLTLDAGSLHVDGDFGALDLDVSAGDLTVAGSASSLDVDMSAGRADILLDGVETAALKVSAGDLRVELTGTAPDSTTIDVSAGSVDLTVPDVEYALTQSTDAGSLDATVDQSSSARRTIDVSLSAGGVTIRPER
ncbi:DUF4097 family beta strand repeat-containing protein [Microbacterium sp. 179-I 3D4 NHS]|uniref:DUF4097 family beta strand repeat-containing protein n=1 Tax=Microbacterium sp. 179-I 3D4 NHS TaxID=3142381 RepID=UPI00399FC16F